MAFDFANLADLGATKAQLRSVAAEPAFAWLKPIVETTLPDFVRRALRDEPPDDDRYSIFALEENVSIANDMVNRCLTRRSQIYDIEANALQTAIGYQQELKLAASDAHLARLRAEADLAAAGQGMSAAIERSLADQAAVRAGALQARIALHNLPGSSINYGEQIAFMREVYADNIRNLLERIDAIRRGLKACHGIDLANLPTAQNVEQQSDDLEWIVWWLRGVVASVEMVERIETTTTVYLPMFRLQGMNAADAQAAWQSFLRGGSVEAVIDENVLLRHGMGGLVVGAPIRVVGVGAALLLGRAEYLHATGQATDLQRNAEVENRLTSCRAFGFPCVLYGPEQEDAMEEASLPLGLVYAIANDAAAAQLQAGDPGRLRNHSPLGTWRVQIGPQAVQGVWHPTAGVVSLQSALGIFPAGSADVVLCLSLAVSPFIQAA